MKILMMTNTYTPIVGGLEKSIQVFSEKFRELGHEVKIVAPAFKNMPKNEKNVIRVPALEKFVGTNFSVSLPLPELILNLVEEYKPDIVHSHHPFLIGDLALRLCGQKKIPLVFTYHTMFEYYQDNFGMDNETMQKFVVDLAAGYANMADQVIVPSKSIGEVLKARKVKAPIEVVPTGIDVKYFAPAPSDYRKKHKISESAFVVGHVGRLAPEKNLPFLTEAVAEFLKQKKDAVFLAVGSGPGEREMKKTFHSWGVEKRAHFAGVLKGDKLVKAYHAMDVFAFASKSETQGIVVAEAMAAGLPVVALDAPGVREVVIDRKNGRLLSEETRKKFSSALLWCAERTASQWKTIQKGALETANHFSAESCAARALAVYKKTVRRHDSFAQDEITHWASLMGRFKAEIEMIANFSRSATSAIVNTVVAKTSVKDRVLRYYEKQIQSLLRSWTIEIKKLRKRKIEKVSKKESEAIEDVMKKIRAYETELTELNRKIFAACDALEKCLADAKGDLEKEFERIGNHGSERGLPNEKANSMA